jgi:hypothetical protein
MKHRIAGLALAGVLAAAGEAGATTMFDGNNVGQNPKFNWDNYIILFGADLFTDFADPPNDTAPDSTGSATTYTSTAPTLSTVVAPGGSETLPDGSVLSNIGTYPNGYSLDSSATLNYGAVAVPDELTIDFSFWGATEDLQDGTVDVSAIWYNSNVIISAMPADPAYAIGANVGSFTLDGIADLNPSGVGTIDFSIEVHNWSTNALIHSFDTGGAVATASWGGTTFGVNNAEGFYITVSYWWHLPANIDPYQNLQITARFATDLEGDPADPVPEPATLALLGLGAAAGAARARRA